MVPTSAEDTIFLKSFDEETNELTFRSSRNPSYNQTEIVVFKDDFVYTNFHYFSIQYLKRLMNE